MKRMALTMVMLTAACSLFARQGNRQQFDWDGGTSYKGTSSSLNFTIEDTVLTVTGKASKVTPGGGGGYVIEAKDNLIPNSAKQFFIKVSGIDGADDFDAFKLLKLELNDDPKITLTPGMRNRNDPTYINARDGEAVFDISRLRNIRKINLVFFNCIVANLRIEAFYE
jgi:hypothetical protein